MIDHHRMIWVTVAMVTMRWLILLLGVESVCRSSLGLEIPALHLDPSTVSQ